MKIATYNVNGVNGRLPVLLRWLAEEQPDIVVLQELKAPQDKFPETAIRDLGYDVIWHGQKSWNGIAMLSRVGEIHETRRGLPGDPDPSQSRYIEAAVNGILIAGLYLSNGNPRPGPKFDYKMAWFDRLIDHAADLLASGAPVVIAGDFNVMPTERDVHKPERWLDDALFAPEVRAAYFRLLDQGWTDSLRTMHPDETIYTFFDYFRDAYARNAGLRIDHLLLSPDLATRLVDAQVDRHVRGWEKTSDHAPTWIELADAKSGRRKRRSTCARPNRQADPKAEMRVPRPWRTRSPICRPSCAPPASGRSHGARNGNGTGTTSNSVRIAAVGRARPKVADMTIELMTD